MGTYIYSLRSPKLVSRVKLDTGDVITVGRYAYEYKPLWSCFGNEPRWQILAKARISRLRKIWDAYINDGGAYPVGGVLVSDKSKGYKIEIGSHVYGWNNGYVPVELEDCTMNNGKVLGKIVEVFS